jgi:mannose-1-phosphate guanylyltransferase
MMFDHYYAVIMAGGGGTRLWPLSRKARPKQMLRLLDDRSLFQTAVDRLEGLFPPQRIIVVTVEEQAKELQLQCPEIPQNNYLLEPMPRGTASVVGFASVVLQKRDPEAVMAVLTSDHFIGNEDGFRNLLRSAFDVASEGYLVTLGISPTYAATGYGYIQQGEYLGKFQDLDVYHVMRFIEKPDQDRAQIMIKDGRHAWNSGMFVWRVDRILGEFQAQMPDLAKALTSIGKVWGSPEMNSVVERVWPGIRSETIDYGIMEGAEQVAVIPAQGLQWNDVGSWESLFDVLPSDESGNIIMGGRHIGLETNDSLVYVAEENRLIVTIGVEDLVLVDTGDVLLVCKKEQAQYVRQIVNQLKENDQRYV